MDKIGHIYNFLIDNYSRPGILLMLSIMALLAVQLRYWLGIYARISRHRNPRLDAGSDAPAVSVVIVARDELGYIEQTLPLLLEQQYPDFEIVIVDMGANAGTSEALDELKQRYPNLHTTRLIQQEQRSAITNKMALNVGIKAASKPNIMLTTTEDVPDSPKWLAMMAKGFIKSEVVIGYCGLEPPKGLAGQLMRAGRLNSSMRWLSSAIAGRPYRGISHNLGYTSRIYFNAKGFDHLDLPVGDDDLFIQGIATHSNTSVVLSPDATMRQKVWGGVGDWFRRELFLRRTWKHYPLWAKNFNWLEIWSRVLLFICCVVAAAFLPMEIGIAVAAILVLRIVAVEAQLARICRRLGEKGLGWIYIIYDFLSPLYAMALWIASIRNPRKQWR